jgi:hypothetical protein
MSFPSPFYRWRPHPWHGLEVWAVMPDGSMDELWDMIADETWTTFEYREVTLDVSAYLGQKIQLAWQYVGFDGESFGLDDIDLPGDVVTILEPSATVWLTVLVDDGVAPGTWPAVATRPGRGAVAGPEAGRTAAGGRVGAGPYLLGHALCLLG